MRYLPAIVLLLLPSCLLSQEAPKSSGEQDRPGIADELNKLRVAIVQQQKQMDEQQKQMAAQQRLMNLQREQIAREQEEMERLQRQITDLATDHLAPRLVDATLKTTPEPNSALQSDSDKVKESPLSFRIGGMDFTPGGFVELENVFRTTNSGSIITTNFGTIPFSNTTQGHLTEDRLTGQFSRLNLKVTGKLGANDITGFAEVDFNGNDAGNAFVTGNSHTLRERLFWVDLKRHNWEILGGQTWSMVTPNRRGISPMPSDLALTYDEDGNVQVGIPYTRAAEFRVIYHPNDHFAAGVAIENSEQFTGSGAGEVAFPNAFTAQLAGQFNPNNANNTTPNVAPDVISKIAYDTDFSGRHFHLEALGLLTTIKTATLAPVGGATFQSHSKAGGSAGAAVNFELVHNFRVLANALYGSGGGHYIIGLGPNAVVHPDGSPSLVHGGTGLIGLEYQPISKDQFGFYYGAAYFQRNAFLDTSAGAKPNTIIGFGGLGSANTNNRSIQQPTFDWTHTFWRNPQYGAIQFISQTSYLTRSPWFVAAGAPKNAHLVMVYTSMRYVLP
ncbi:MAG TPA: hypothetical protein VHA33_27870 [Candidatus Angelobacter sp.]|jgi:hypothetical protein|nr:hypothetical protein [Candidatus Angelobacter sp.]